MGVKNKQMIKSLGFTLVELSIVIIIIGFLIAGIAAGQSLIQQAKLNSVITEFKEFDTALQTFKIRYNYLPGDFPDAYSYWGAACAPVAEDCNGNGDNSVDAIPGFAQFRQESYRFWQHLNLAGILPGNYSGFSNLPNYAATIGLNLPASKFTPGGWYFGYTGSWFMNNVDPLLIKAQYFQVGARRDISTVDYPLFTPTEASNLDSKIDDGHPYTGSFKSLEGFDNGNGTLTFSCVVGNGATATYDYSQSSPQCWSWILPSIPQ